MYLNPLNAELNPICHLLALLGGATIVVVSRLRVNFPDTPGSLPVTRNRQASCVQSTTDDVWHSFVVLIAPRAAEIINYCIKS